MLYLWNKNTSFDEKVLTLKPQKEIAEISHKNECLAFCQQTRAKTELRTLMLNTIPWKPIGLDFKAADAQQIVIYTEYSGF